MEPAALLLRIPISVRNAVHTINFQEFGRQKVKPIKESVLSNKAQIVHNDKQSINIGTRELQQSYNIYVPVANAGK